MIRILISIVLLSICIFHVNAQKIINPKFEKRLEELLDQRIPIITVKEAQENCDDFIFLDAREMKEYKTSHIPNATYIGYDHFSISKLKGIPKSKKIIVYCSVGYRSERVGEKLEKLGYTDVYNLYGSIFEWVNNGFPIEDENGNETKIVHTYNKRWSQWVDHPEVVKVW